ncbi:MAG: hypothetical protein U0L12_11235 [Ruminococcus sp.]|nr:hypothetical protein [Ruminococcus sp.]
MENSRNQELIFTKDDANKIHQQEDAALKVVAQYFQEELLNYLGITGKVVGIAPTESVHVELRKFYQDFNFVMEDGTWKHLEFQSTDKGIQDLKRFRVYEALTSYTNNVEITTYVLYSGKIKNPITEYTEGVNTYRIQPIIMNDKDAQKILEKLQEKMEHGEEIEKIDLLPLALCPLMGGDISLKERIFTAYEITKKVTTVNVEDIQKIEAVLYIMADKFLDSKEMEELRKEIKMTRLGQMIYADGREEGLLQGIRVLIETCNELGQTKNATITKVVEKFGITNEAAERNVEEYWK